MVGAAAAPNVWVAAVSVAVAGTGNGAAVVCNALLVQRRAGPAPRPCVHAAHEPNYVVLGIGMIAAGPLTDELGPRTVYRRGLSAVAALVGLLLARGVAMGVRPAEASAAEPEAVETARL